MPVRYASVIRLARVEPMTEAAAKAARQGRAERFAVVGALTSMVTVVLSIIRSKMVALTVGPLGVGIVAEVVQLLTLAAAVVSVASGPALLRWISQAHAAADSERLERGLGTGVLLASGLAVGAGIACAVLAPALLPTGWPVNVRFCVLLAALSVALNAVGACINQVHVARADLGAIGTSSLLTGILGTAAIVVLVPLFGVPGQFYSLALGSAFSVAVTWGLMARRVRPRIRLRAAWDAQFVKEAFTVGAVSIVSGYVAQALLSWVRVVLQHAGASESGAEYNGNFQAAYAIATTYISAILAGVGNFYFPRFAAAAPGRDLDEEVHACADFVLRYAPVLAFAAIAFRSEVIRVLYSDRFVLASDMLGFMLAADVLRVVSWSYAGPLPMRGAVRAFLLTEVGALAVGAPAVWMSVRWFGAMGVGIGFFGLNVVYLGIAAFVASRSCGIQIRASHMAKALGLGFGAALFNVLVSRYGWVRWAAVPVLAVVGWRVGLGPAMLVRARGVLRRLLPARG
jgi:O-antigen/teichoic acid export membrane protein